MYSVHWIHSRVKRLDKNLAFTWLWDFNIVVDLWRCTSLGDNDGLHVAIEVERSG